MPYIVDGHNLIPKVPGLTLDDPEDELQLVKLLQEFCRVNRKKVEVYFDNAPVGGQGSRSYGGVITRFVRQGTTADQAIKKKLKRLGGEARNWTVISSDHEVRDAAKSVRAKVVTAEEFARQLANLPVSMEGETDSEVELSQEDVEEWLEFFGFEETDEGLKGE
jgi:predicted RNA-binding protein with PIN domain